MSTERLALRHQDEWEQEFAYEIRALKLFTRCTRESEYRIICGDKSGRITCFSLDRVRAWEEKVRGPVYDLSFVHPLQDGNALLETRRQPCLVAAGTGGGELIFLDYLSGQSRAVICADDPGVRLSAKGAVLSLLFIESLHELWMALAGGTIERLRFQFSGDAVSACFREPVEVGEAVSSLCFMPGSCDHSGEGHGQGWVCAATMLGNLYRLDHRSESPLPRAVLKAPVSAPIRTALSLSRVFAEHGSKGDALVCAYGGNLKYVVQDWREGAELGSLDQSCADRVLCLGRADWRDSVWLIAGANDARLHFYRLHDTGLEDDDGDEGKEHPRGKGLLNQFADRRYSIPLEERVLKVVVQDRKSLGHGDSRGLNIYVALGNHRLKAFRLLPREEFRNRLEKDLGERFDLQAILVEIRRSPDNPVLRRNVSALLFRARWLSRYVGQKGLDPEDQRRLRLVIYHLLGGTGIGGVREILSGILEIANDHPLFRQEATNLARHIGKYCLDGHSFSDKVRDLDELARFNEENGGDYIYDAAIYRSLLAERRYTEQEVFSLDDPLTSLQSLEIPGCGSRFLLATSYWQGRIWLLDRVDQSRFELVAKVDGRPAAGVQRAVVWKEESSSTTHVIFFFLQHGWTSHCLGDFRKRPDLAPLQPIEGARDLFYAYSCLVLPGGVIAVGGRTADVSLLQVVAREPGGLQLTLRSQHGGDVRQHAPVRALAYRPLGKTSGELFAGCDNGACYRFRFDGQRLGQACPVYQSPSASQVRVIACHGQDHLLIGDGALLVLLRRDGEPSADLERPELIREWAVRLRGSVTGAVAATLRVPPRKEPCAETAWDDRPVVLVSDSEGVVNVLRLGETLEHSFAVRLDGGQPLSIEYLAPLAFAGSPGAADAESRTQVAIACSDQTVRVLALSHRRESVRYLNRNLASATAATLAGAHGLPQGFQRAACAALNSALDSPGWSIPEVARAVAQATEGTARLSDQNVRNALEEVAWKLASANVQSEAPGILALRLRYDDPDLFEELLKQLKDLSLGEILAPGKKRLHIRLRYCLRFAFKILARWLEPGREVDEVLRKQMARLVELCHELAQNWGPGSSGDNLRCKLAIVHMLCRFATRQSLEWLLGDELQTDHPLRAFLEDRLLNDPRLAVPFRAIQHFRRMIDYDHETGNLREPVLGLLVPLLVRRFRNCRVTQDDDWIGAEIYLCLLSVGRSYGYSPWTFVASLLREECPPPLLELLADRQRAFPPGDERCCEVVEALSRIMNLPLGDPQANEVRRVIFERLDGIEGLSPAAAAPEDWQEIFISLRTLCAVAIAFDTNSNPEMRTLAHQEILTVPERSLVDVGSTKALDLRLLLRCAMLLLQLSQPPQASFEAARKTYLKLKDLSAGLLTDAESDPAGPDVARILFLAARELLRRQIQIELDFVAPIRFLQERSFAESAVDEGMLASHLLGYATLYGDLSRARKSLLLRKDPSAKGLIVEPIGERAEDILVSPSAVRQRLTRYLHPYSLPEVLKVEALKLMREPHVTEGATNAFVAMGADSVGEIVPIHREDQRYGLMFFVFDRASAPDPSKRALSRMVSQLLVSEFMRSVQNQRLLGLTFHHIRGPVSAMRVMLKTMEDGFIEPDEQAEYLQELRNLAEDCHLMINNQMNYMRMVRGIAPPIRPTRFDLVEEAEFRRRIIQFRAKENKQVIRWNARPDRLQVYLDRILVGDIIQNLLDNASKYSPEKSEIQLSIRTNKRDVFIEVADQGPGLPQHVAPLLFGEGVRGDSALERRVPGLGLGLSMVYRYAVWLDGDVWSESNTGGGTLFTVHLPREVKT